MAEFKAQKCGNCLTPIPAGAKYCPGCASRVPQDASAQDDVATPTDASADEETVPAAAQTSAEAVTAGTVIDGKYEVRGLLGAGGFGEVFRIHHRLLGMDCALKIIHPHLLRSARIRERFLREARVLMEVSHPNVVTIRDVGEWGGRFYMVMDLCLGQTVAALLTERRRIPARAAAAWVTPILSALNHAHRQGLIHRDLKPSNLALAPTGGGKWTIKILDFGLAKILREDEAGQPRKLSADGSAIGTPMYMSPEQINGKTASGGPVDARADLFAVGVVLYEMITGRRPFGGGTVEEIYKQILFDDPPTFASLGIPDELPGLEAVVRQALSKDPAGRPQSAAEMSARLIALLGAAATKERPEQAAAPATPSPDAAPAAAATPRPASAPAAEAPAPRPAPSPAAVPPAVTPPRPASAPAAEAPAPRPAPASPPSAAPRARAPVATSPKARPTVAPTPPQADKPTPARRPRWLPAAAIVGIVAVAAAGFALFHGPDPATSGVAPVTGTSAGDDAPNEQRFAAAMKAGQDALTRVDLSEATARFAEALQLRPGDPQAQAGADDTQKAILRQKKEEEERAAAARVEREYGAAMADGRALAAQGNGSGARAAFEKAVQAKPGDPAAQAALAELARSEVDERFASAMKAGEAALAQGDPDTAEARFAEALQARPADAQALARSDEARSAVARKRQEEEDRAASARIDREFRALLEEGRTLAAQGKLVEARAAYGQAEKMKPGDPATQGALEELARSEADERFSAAMRAGEDALAQGDPETAEARFAEALEAKPGDAAALARSGAAQEAAETKRKENAAAGAVAAAEREYQANMDKGQRLQGQGRWQDASAAYELALKARPGDARAKEALAETGRRQLEQKFEAAMQAGEEALARGNPEVAQSRFGEALRLKPADGKALARQAAAKEQAERKRAAVPTERTSTPAEPVTLSSLTQIGKNDAGLMEYLHEASGITLVLVPAGEFAMGSPPEEVGRSVDEDLHKVRITHGLLIGKTEVTNAQFRRFRAGHSSRDHKGASLDGADQPAVGVSWAEAAAFCAWAGMRLPTEAEWEYVARGDKREQVFPWGRGWPPRKGEGNLAGEELPKAFPDWSAKSVIEGYDDGHSVTAPVGQFKANPFGLFDLAGNVWEWCSDWYQTSLGTAAADDPTGPAKGDVRVLRGGAWNSELRKTTRCAARSKSAPAKSSTNIGFRVAAGVETR